VSSRADTIQAAVQRAFHPDATVVREGKNEVRVCGGTSCGGLGGRPVVDAFNEELSRRGIDHDWRVVETGCLGLCAQGPIVVIQPLDVFYPRVGPESVPEIVDATLVGGKLVEHLLHEDPASGCKVARLGELPFYKRGPRVVMSLSGEMDPASIDDYLAQGGYGALAGVLMEDDPEALIDLVAASGLHGRGDPVTGGAARWRHAREAVADRKFLVCSAVDMEPGAPVDGSVIVSVPHQVIEGASLAAFAVGAAHGVLYVPSRHRRAIERLELALLQCRDRGLLGDDVLGSGWRFDLSIAEGEDVAVCRDATALMASLEGHRAAPRAMAATPSGPCLWERPTVTEGAATLAAVPWIVANGAAAYGAAGVAPARGTRMLMLMGGVRNTGLVEAPNGATLREVVEGLGGGVESGRELKAVLLGGALGSCLPASFLDMRLTAEELRAVGAGPDFGSVVAVDDGTCLVDLARSLLAHSQRESCGKCVPCRLGTRRMLEVLERIVSGQGREGDIELLEEVGQHCAAGTQCDLGAGAADPVLSTLRFFRDEYEAHILEKRCPAGSCPALVTFSIEAERCTGCGECLPTCPVGAIEGRPDHAHVIDIGGCRRCGTCREVCRFGAIVVRSGIAPAVASSHGRGR